MDHMHQRETEVTVMCASAQQPCSTAKLTERDGQRNNVRLNAENFFFFSTNFWIKETQIHYNSVNNIYLY